MVKYIIYFTKRISEGTWRGQEIEENTKGYIIRVNIKLKSTGVSMPVITILKSVNTPSTTSEPPGACHKPPN